MSKARWHVLGAGAIGSLFALRLAENRVPVTLVLRAPNSDALTLTRSGVSGPAQQCFAVETAGSGTPIQHLLVTTKAHQVCDAVCALAPRLTPGANVILLANGMGFAGELASALPGLRPTLATTTEGAYRTAPDRVHHAGRGDTRFGQPGQRQAPAWFAPFAEWPDCHWERDIEPVLWRKLAINGAINALTAIHHCRNGTLARDPLLARQVRALCAEITEICRAQGQAQAARQLESAVFAVIRATADNRSSMLQDVERGQRTEIDYINGYLLRAGREAGLSAPLNEALLDRVRQLEPA